MYMLLENISKVWGLNRGRKNKFTHLLKFLTKQLLQKTTQPFLNKNGF